MLLVAPIIWLRVGGLSVRFLTPGALGRPKLPDWRAAPGRESRPSAVGGLARVVLVPAIDLRRMVLPPRYLRRLESLQQSPIRGLCRSDRARARVRNSFLKKKLGLTSDDLDEAIESVCAAMKADRTKSRLTFYYLLAERFGKLDMFVT